MDIKIPQLPEWVLNVGMHAIGGFLIGFSASLSLAAIVPGSSMDVLETALWLACTAGGYRAFKEAIAYLETVFPATARTAATADQTMPIQAPKKSLASRMP